MNFLSFLMLVIVVPIALGTSVLLVEIVAAILTKRNFDHFASNIARPSIAVVVPAHNESAGLLPTLNDITAQLRRDDRLLVVADNCSDDTADVAEAAGAEVIKRNDLKNVGKGYALDFGFRYLKGNVPRIVIVVDADCRLEEGAINQLALTCNLTGKPVPGALPDDRSSGHGESSHRRICLADKE